mgnify:FL=1
MTKQKKAIIIGGGLGGLSTAINLLNSSFEVMIIEKNKNLGGKMNIFQKEGHTFDTGPSLITLPHIFENLFKKIDENIHDHIKLLKINPLFLYMFENEKIEYSSNLSSIEKIYSDSQDQLENFYQLISKGSRLFNLSENTFFEQSLFSKPKFSNLKLLLQSPYKVFFQKYNKLIEKTFEDEKLRKIFNRYPTYVGSSPYKATGILSVIPFMELSYGAWYIEGGIYKLIEALENIILQKNVEIRKDTKVSKINHKNSKIESVTLNNGEEIKCDVVVSNVDPIITKSMLDNNAKIKNQSLSMSGLVLLVGTNKKFHELLHHNVIFSDDYENEFNEIFEQKKFPTDPTVYINCPTKNDKTLAPEGCESIFIMCNTPATEDSWGTSKIKDSISKIRKTLEKQNLEKLIDDAKFIEVITPNDFEKKYAAPYGSIYGKVSHGLLGTIRRPSNKDKKIKGLYYVGGGVHPGGGTPIVIMSSNIVTKEIVKDYV